MFSMPFRAGFFGVDKFRYGIEQMHPAEYLSSRYYEHWMHTVEHHGGAKPARSTPPRSSARTQHYLEHPDEPLPQTKDPDLLAFVDAAVKRGAPARRESRRRAKFAVGDQVRVIDDSPLAHTRKARYVRGKTGEIVLAHGTFIYPDSAGNGLGDDPKHVYTRASFDASDLWGEEDGDPNGSVNFDVWEPYLERSPSSDADMTAAPTARCPLVHQRSDAEVAARMKALESIMIEKGIMTTEAVDRLAEIYENEVGPQLGAARRRQGLERSGLPGAAARGRDRRPAPSSGSADCRARTWSSWRTPTRCTT